MGQFIGTIVGTIVGAIVGTIVTWAVAYCYYVKTAQDLRLEAQKLRKLTILMLRAMEDSGLAELNYDKGGEPIGLKIHLKGTAAAKSSVTGSVIVEKKK